MVKKFLTYYKPHMGLFTLDFSCAFLMSIMDLIFPIFAKEMIDNIIPNNSVKIILLCGFGILILYILRSVLEYIVNYWGHVLGVRMEYDMRKELFNHINKLSFSYFDNNKTGQIMSRLVNDLNEISELAHHGPEDLFITLITLIGSFIIMFNLNFELSLVILIIIPIMFIFSMSKNRKMRKSFREIRVKIGNINAKAEDSISGIRVVKAFTNEEYEHEKFDEGNCSFKETKEYSYKAMGEFFSGISFFSNFINLVVLIYGGILVSSNKLSVGELMGFLLYVSMFLQPIRKISSLIESYQKGMAGFNRFIEILELEPDIKDKKSAKKLENVVGKITFDNVSFSYNNKKSVLKNINFTIQAGKNVAFVGPSGGGKTTLCSLIPRFYEIDEGSIKIDGVDIQDVTQKSLRENIGIVQQDVFLFSGTIRENILYGKVDSSDEDVIEAAKRANAHDFIMNLENGYDTNIGERGVKLSGGQKQRISIARVFLKNPPILILDEATSALDNESEKLIQESLYELSKNRTTLIIAHRLTTIKNAHSIMVLTDDGIVENGTHKDLINRGGVYEKLYQSQFSD